MGGDRKAQLSEQVGRWKFGCGRWCGTRREVSARNGEKYSQPVREMAYPASRKLLEAAPKTAIRGREHLPVSAQKEAKPHEERDEAS